MLADNAALAEAPAPPSPLRPDAAAVWEQLSRESGTFLGEVSRRLLQQIEAFEPEAAAPAGQALRAGGKHLRPLLVASAGRATGRTGPAHVEAAVIVELVHLATLVHDDIIDDAQVRRRQPTVAATHGSQVAVLAGDCLFAHALELAAGFPTPEVCRLVAAATKRVCTGEILQTLRRDGFGTEIGSYFRVIEMKTGELFAVACELGVLLAGGDAAVRAAARRFGLDFGTAFQIYDDCLDLFGSEATAGKTLGTDLMKGKVTLPLLLAHRDGSVADRRRLEEFVDDWHPGRQPALAELLRRHDAGRRSLEVVLEHVGRAREALDALPVAEGRRALARLTDVLGAETARLAPA
ncbi:MAG: polyprenyl synthetase family protein [Limisphaerales bacterium]